MTAGIVGAQASGLSRGWQTVLALAATWVYVAAAGSAAGSPGAGENHGPILRSGPERWPQGLGGGHRLGLAAYRLSVHPGFANRRPTNKAGRDVREVDLGYWAAASGTASGSTPASASSSVSLSDASISVSALIRREISASLSASSSPIDLA